MNARFTPIAPTAAQRLAAFDEAVSAEYTGLYDDPAYADCDEELNKLFRKFDALKDELVAQCGQYLEACEEEDIRVELEHDRRAVGFGVETRVSA